MRAYDRRKRVTDPLHDRVKARLDGRDNSGFSSGSEYSATADDDSPCLSELVIGFLEEDQQVLSEIQDNESDSERVDSTSCLTDAIIGQETSGIVDSYKELIQTQVSEAVEVFSDQRCKKSIFRRSVMFFLRELGHNAAICKTRWDSSAGLTSGNYEFIDVVVSSKYSSASTHTRYFIDLEFASEFEIARPSAQFSKLLQSLPRIFVGNAEELKQIVRVISDSAKKSLKRAELSMPPWKKNRYMQNKWFGSYRRTTNPMAENPFSPVIDPVSGIKCRLVGFHDAVSGSSVYSRPVVRIS